MSVKINGTAITMTRGDTLEVVVDIFEDAAHQHPYEPDPEDEIRFAMKHPSMAAGRTAYLDDTPVLVKTIPNDTLTLYLAPADTKTLAFGEYVYDIELKTASGVVDTFITTAPFTITPEVH